MNGTTVHFSEQGRQSPPTSPVTTTSVGRRIPPISSVNIGICLLYGILSNPYSSGSGPMQTSPHRMDPPRRILLNTLHQNNCAKLKAVGMGWLNKVHGRFPEITLLQRCIK
jgi:hypothetical protein